MSTMDEKFVNAMEHVESVRAERDALQAENTRLREALTQIKDSLGLSARDAKNIAELALAEGKGEKP